MDPNPWIVSSATVTRKSQPAVTGTSARIWFSPENMIAHVQVKASDHFIEIPGDDVLDIEHA